MEIFCRDILYSQEHVDIKNIHLFRTKLIFSLLKFKGTASVRSKTLQTKMVMLNLQQNS